MIRLQPSPDPELAYGLNLLVDLARLLPVASGELAVSADSAVLLQLHERTSPPSIEGDTLHVESGRVDIPMSAVRAAARMAGAAEETASRARDAHGRVPPIENELVRTDRAMRPVLEEWARELRRASFRAAAGRPFWCLPPWPGTYRWAAAITHDLDIVTGWPAMTVLRIAELMRGKHLELAWRSLAAGMRSMFSEPVHAAAHHLLDVEERNGVPATWFILCGDPTLRSMAAKDVTYRVESEPVRRLLQELRMRNVELGLHGSFATARDGALLSAQRVRLQDAVGLPVRGVRQHFLRMRLPETLRDMETAGFDYDSTFGFPDRAGFRLGVADVVTLWDAPRRAALRVDEVPFAWMDRSGSKYSGIEDPNEWLRTAEETARSVRQHEGVWVGIWHPYLTDALGYPGTRAAFEALVRLLSAERPWFATLSQIVDWRRSRRMLRAVPQREGPPHLLGTVSQTIALEGANGEICVVDVRPSP